MRRVALLIVPITALAASDLLDREPSIVQGPAAASRAVAAPSQLRSSTGVTVIDLGTVNGAWSEARHINSGGQVIGGSTIVYHEPTGFLSANGVMTALGMGARAINGAGTVAGGRRSFAGGTASVWKNGKITDLGTLGGPWSYALHINESGQVGGWSENAAGQERAFLWANGVITDLGSLGGGVTWFGDMNDAGEVVGGSWTSATQYHAFVWSHGRMTDLGTLGGPSSFAAAINEGGQVVGWSHTTGGTPTDRGHAFLWANGVMTDLGTMGGLHSRATAINEAGQVMGYSATDGDGKVRGFLWANGVMTDLGTLGGLESWPTDINDAGQVVGWSATGAGEHHAFLWVSGAMTDLGTLGGSSSEAIAINEAGQVVGWSTTTDNSSRARAALWLPPPAANTAPTVMGTGPDQRIEPGQPVTVSFTFTEATPNGPWIWEASWGDGATSAGSATSTGQPITTSHAYAAPGRYIVRIAVRDAAGAAGTDGVALTIGRPAARNKAPVVTASRDQEAWTDEKVFVTARFDDQATPNGPWTWEINWGDGVKSHGLITARSSVVSASHGYVAAGQFVARVTVTDRAGAAGSDTVAFAITANTAPIVHADVAQHAEIGRPVEAPFSFTDGTPTSTWSLHIDWGDGTSTTDAWSKGPDGPIRPFHTYAAAGRYSVIITVRDQLGAAGADTLVMRVGPMQWIEAMIQQVNALVAAGSLTQDRANHLLAKLRKAFAKLDSGRTRPAIKELEGFIKQGEGFVRGGVLGPEQGQVLIQAARRTIGQLR